MRPLAAACVAVALSAAAPAEAALTGCSDAIPLDLSGPRPTLAFTLADGRSGVAMFDTGSRGTFADSGRAERLGLVDEGPGGGHGAAGGYRSTLRGLTIGDVALGDVPVPVMATGLPGIDLVLGPQTFSGRLVELDMASATLRICAMVGNLAALGEATPYDGAEFALPAMPIVIGGRALLAMIDTGSPMPLSFPTGLIRTLPLTGAPVKAGIARGHAGESPVFKARVDGAVRIGPEVLDSPEVTFTDVLPGPTVGAPLLRRFVITIDAAGRRAWVRKAVA